MPLWTSIYVGLFWAALLPLSAVCFWRGDRPVRWGAAAYCVATIAQPLSRKQTSFSHLMTTSLLLDVTLLVALTVLAIRYQRWWLNVMAALQLLTCLGHVAKLLNPHISQLTYALLIGSSGYPMLLLLAIGLLAPTRSHTTSPRRPA